MEKVRKLFLMFILEKYELWTPPLCSLPALEAGRYKAMSLLSTFVRELITPLIEVPEKGYDLKLEQTKNN